MCVSRFRVGVAAALPLLLSRKLAHLLHYFLLEFDLLSLELVHSIVLVDVNVSGCFTAPPFVMGFATRNPFLALSSGMGLLLSTTLLAEIALLFIGWPRS